MMTPQLPWIALGLAVLAALSRLLTLLHMWQLKEWRIDRLREHLRAEGVVTQLWGRTDIPLAVFASAVWMASGSPLLGTLALLPLAGSAALKMATRRQLTPAWTQKAIAFGTVASALLALIGYACMTRSSPLLPFLPIAAPVALIATWMGFKPLDTLLKARVMRRAKALRAARPDLTVIGIAGSVGKTTTKELLSHILESDGVRATPAHVNTEMGVSAWMTRVLSAPDAGSLHTLIIEMGAYKKGEVRLLCDITQPALGIVTYIGQDHLALFGSEEAICEANGELPASLPAQGTAFLNADNAFCETLRARSAGNVVTVGTGGHADIEAYDIEETGKGIRFRALDTLFEVPLHGTHNVTNVLLAIAAARHTQMDLATIAKRLRSFTPLRHTFAIREERGITIVDDTYNASPQSFKAAIEWAKGQPHDCKILVTSGVIELGSRESRIHAELGALAKHVFGKVYILNKKFIPFFAQGYGKENIRTQEAISPAPPSSLLVCVGRMKESVIRSLLP